MTTYIWLRWYLLSFDFDGSLPEGMLLFIFCRWRIEAQIIGNVQNHTVCVCD